MNSDVVEFHEYVISDILGHIEGISSKRMFGGYGLYLEVTIFGIITSDSVLYFKVDETNKAQFELRGSAPFVYTGRKDKKPITMPYWRVPEEVMEDKDMISDWVHMSAAISKK